jgi:hypothetical protein
MIYSKIYATRRKAVIYGVPCAAKKWRKRFRTAVIAAVEPLTDPRFLDGPSRLISAPVSGIGRVPPSLALRINMTSSPWLREKAVLQW